MKTIVFSSMSFLTSMLIMCMLLIIVVDGCSLEDSNDSQVGEDVRDSSDVISVADLLDVLEKDSVGDDLYDDMVRGDFDVNLDVADASVIDVLFEDILDVESDAVNSLDGGEGLEDGSVDAEILEDVLDIEYADVSDVSTDVGPIENYDRFLVVTHPYGPDGSTCGRDIEFFKFLIDGTLSRTGARLEVGDCPIKAKFSPDGSYLFVVNNNNHNPQAGTQSVVVLKEDGVGGFVKFKQFNEFSMQNPEFISFNRKGDKAFIVDFNIEGEGGIHIIEKSKEDWIYKKEVSLALPRSMVVLPDDSYALIVGGHEPVDTAIMDIEREEIIAQYDLFSDFVDALGIDVDLRGEFVVVPNSSPYSELGNTISSIRLDYISGSPVPSLSGMLADVNEPSASLFTVDGKYVVVTNFSKNYSSLFEFKEGVFSLKNRITSMPLADTMTMIKRGDYKDFFFVNALSDIHILKIENGSLVRVSKFVLGQGNENMLGDIDIQP